MGQAGPLNLVFMGTPDLAATVLRHLLAWDGGRVRAVYCRPDKPAGRGMAVKTGPVKALAMEYGLPVRQPRNFNDAAQVALLRESEPDYLLVAAYGLVLPESVLAAPRRLPLNVHTSLLPRHRGAAPIQRAVINGDTVTGVSVMVMEAALDAGPVVLRQPVPIGPDDTAADLRDALAECGGKALIKALQGLESGGLVPVPQDAANASYAAKLEKNDGLLDFSRTGEAIYARARGVTPWPGAFFLLARGGGAPLHVALLEGKPLAGLAPETARLPVGAVLPGLVGKALAVRCADGLYLITSVRPAGRKTMDAAAFMNGYLKGYEASCFASPPR